MPTAYEYCLLPTAYCLLPTAYCLLPTAYCLLPTAYCLLPTAYCLLPTAYCLLPTAYCLLPTACCLLPTAYCLLPSTAACCLLPTGCLYCLRCPLPATAYCLPRLSIYRLPPDVPACCLYSSTVHQCLLQYCTVPATSTYYLLPTTRTIDIYYSATYYSTSAPSKVQNQHQSKPPPAPNGMLGRVAPKGLIFKIYLVIILIFRSELSRTSPVLVPVQMRCLKAKARYCAGAQRPLDTIISNTKMMMILCFRSVPS